MSIFLFLSLVTSFIMNWYNRRIALNGALSHERSLCCPRNAQAAATTAWNDGVFLAGKAEPFLSPLNIALTLLGFYLLYLIIPRGLPLLVLDAVWTGENREACLPSEAQPRIGACWAYVRDFSDFFIYAFYPREEIWRINLTFVLFAIGLAWVLWIEAPKRGWGAIYFFVIFPVIAFFLIYGAPSLGLPIVTTEKWGGIMVSLIIAFTGIARLIAARNLAGTRPPLQPAGDPASLRHHH